MKKRNDTDEEKLCALCERAQTLADESVMLCSKRGVVACDYSCRSFCYDPLKRRPVPASALPGIALPDAL